MRADPNRVIKWVPDSGTIGAARIASEKFLRLLNLKLLYKKIQQNQTSLNYFIYYYFSFLSVGGL